MALPVGTVPPAAAAVATTNNTNRPKRLCRFPGCTKTIKSQGHCQRHGARSKRCRVDGCEKQAQGTHNGMCKRHWKAQNAPAEEGATAAEPEVLEPVGESAYDSLLPRSIAYRPAAPMTGATDDAPTANNSITTLKKLMPLVEALKEGAETKPVGWHRNAERAARGLPAVENMSNHLESWEKQLALIEILLLSGGTPEANFRHLAHAWGRDRGFHHVLINTVCERRGEIERKKRSDARGGGGAFTFTAATTPAAKRIKRETNPPAGAASVSMQEADVLPVQKLEDDDNDESSPRKKTVEV